jgi:hypothetical protein
MTGLGKIHIKKSHKGLLHSDTGTPQGDKVPMSKMRSQKANGSPAERKRATFALNARNWNK